MNKKKTNIRGCLFFNRGFYKSLHAIALDMQDRYGIENWSAFVTGELAYDFAKKSIDIKYSHLLVDEFLDLEAKKEVVDEEWLEKKEQEYGEPLMRAFISDRHYLFDWPRKFYMEYDPILSHLEIKQHLQIRIKKTEEFLDKAKPDFILVTSMCTLGTMVLYYVAKKRGIKIINFGPTPIGSRIQLSDNIYGYFNWVEEKFKLLKEGKYLVSNEKEAFLWLENFRKNSVKPWWDGPFEQKVLSSPILFLKNLVRVFLDYFKRDDFPRGYQYNPLQFIRRNFLTFINLHFRTPKFDEASPAENYVFFPLHYEPELSLMVWAPPYTDQFNIIKNIAESIPINFKLYVKEHPAMVGLRRNSFYNKLKKIPNVKLVNTRINSLELIRNAKLIMTITGTAGFEAILLNKPVITFGRTFYSFLEQSKRCFYLEQLPFLIKEAISDKVIDDKSLIQVLSILFEDSIPYEDTQKFFYGTEEIDLIKISAKIKRLSDKIVKLL